MFGVKHRSDTDGIGPECEEPHRCHQRQQADPGRAAAVGLGQETQGRQIQRRSQQQARQHGPGRKPLADQNSGQGGRCRSAHITRNRDQGDQEDFQP